MKAIPGLLLLLAVTGLRAQTIGNWNFNGSITGSAGIFNTVTTADFSASVPTHAFNGGAEYFGENGWPSGTINSLMYMQFSLAPQAGYQLDISTLVLRLRRSNTGSPAGSGPTGWSLRSSLDGYATNVATGSLTHNYADFTITPGAGFTNIYSAITFRLYGFSASVGSGGSSRLVVDNIRVNGIGYLLPARLGAIACTLNAGKATLSYTVFQSAIYDLHYIERSADGLHFSTIAVINGTNEGRDKKYTYTDDISPLAGAGKLYYRVRLVNSGGAADYSGIASIQVSNTGAAIRTFKNNNQLYINGFFKDGGNYYADIYSTGGQVTERIAFTAMKGYNAFTFNLNKPIPGGCIIKLTGYGGFAQSVYSVTR